MCNLQRIFKSIANKLFGKQKVAEKTKVTHIDVPVPHQEKTPGKFEAVHTCRRRTRGRWIYYQIIRDHLGNVLKTVKHLQTKRVEGSSIMPMAPSIEQAQRNHRICMERWGCKEFSMPGNPSVTVWARDQKNADRKLNNLLAKEV